MSPTLELKDLPTPQLINQLAIVLNLSGAKVYRVNEVRGIVADLVNDGVQADMTDVDILDLAERNSLALEHMGTNVDAGKLEDYLIALFERARTEKAEMVRLLRKKVSVVSHASDASTSQTPEEPGTATLKVNGSARAPETTEPISVETRKSDSAPAFQFPVDCFERWNYPQF